MNQVPISYHTFLISASPVWNIAFNSKRAEAVNLAAKAAAFHGSWLITISGYLLETKHDPEPLLTTSRFEGMYCKSDENTSMKKVQVHLESNHSALPSEKSQW